MTDPTFIRLLGTPEFVAFMHEWEKKDDPLKYNKGVFEDAWIQHCRGLELGVFEPLAAQDDANGKRRVVCDDEDKNKAEPTALAWDPKTHTWKQVSIWNDKNCIYLGK